MLQKFEIHIVRLYEVNEILIDRKATIGTKNKFPLKLITIKLFNYRLMRMDCIKKVIGDIVMKVNQNVQYQTNFCFEQFAKSDIIQ